jgi:energy-coupling factor transporter ATP-binding protein EcfA2
LPDAVTVENLSFRYHGTPKWILKDLNLRIRKGEIVVLAGLSGCGKSTLLRSMNGLIPHMYTGDYSGSVAVDGLVVERSPMKDLAKRVGFLFQNPENQIFMFSVERDVAFGLGNLGVERRELRKSVDEAMRLLGISALADRAPHELSDGQKQRVALAGVIAMRPEIIILDEPTSLLDPMTASELVDLVKQLNGELSMTFVLVEHRLDLLTMIADRMMVMYEGKIVLEGKPSQVLSDERAQSFGVLVPSIQKLTTELKKEDLLLQSNALSPQELATEVNLLLS